MKKILKFLTLSLLVICSFTANLPEAEAYFACAGTPRCADAKLQYGQAMYASSSSVYFTQGETIYYSWENDKPGIMHVAFYISKGGVQVGEMKFAAREGMDYGFYTVKESGYYYLTGACEGGNDTRCQGGGTIQLW
ncbi:hypothetical protein R6U77_06185 [Lysinibacillus louembei]|uniref:Uncharacterized protein n=1 Tax=Lysinibacillus louembei TaxID=1470088 RepID=A0ABZ0S5G9_9BACI|nr:hypothetical protein [Lysinibacillus louembei]WPK13262.1 hypothetical protein R6U77_06185 [Lysinibacillus louembei]